MIEKVKETIAEEKIKEFIHTMEELGINPVETIKLMEKTAKEMTK